MSLQQFANDTEGRLGYFDIVIMGNGVHTIVETAKTRRFGSQMKMADASSAIESYKKQMGDLIPVFNVI